MPIHDWTRVNAGLFHHFHQRWIQALCDVLNAGRLTPGYFALSEQVTGGPIPDVLTLQTRPMNSAPAAGGLAVADAPPRATFVRRAEPEQSAAKANRVAIRNPLDVVVAVIEIVSLGNKESRTAIRRFVEKSVGSLDRGVHLLVVDLFPPGPRDPAGIHKAIWDEIREEPFEPPPGKSFTVASCQAGPVHTTYFEPVAVGDALPSLPIFLDADTYSPAPLEETYQTTWSVCPVPLRDAVTG